MKKVDEKSLITAGAYYRLTKEILCHASIEIGRSLDLRKQDWNKLCKIHDKFSSLEDNIGFESIAQYSGFSGKLTDLFYGNFKANYSETDEAVLKKTKEILLSYIADIDEALNEHA